MLDFPNSPATGTTFTSPNGGAWAWDGVKWNAAINTGYVIISDTPPTAYPGALWFDSVSGELYLRYSDPNSTQWVVANSGAMGGYVAKAGDTMTGQLTINRNTTTPTTTPAAETLTIYGADGNFAGVEVSAFGASVYPVIQTSRSRGTAAAPTAVQQNDILVSISATGYAASAYGPGNASAINVLAAENWTATANGTTLYLQTIAPGTTTPINSLYLRGNTATFSGTIYTGGAYIFMNGAITGSPGTAGGPFIYADAANILLHNGSPTGTFSVQNGNGGEMMFMDSSGNAKFDGNLVVNGLYHTFSGAAASGVNTTGGPFIYADTNYMSFHIGSANGGFNFQNYSGTNVATLNNIGDLYVGQNISSGDATITIGNGRTIDGYAYIDMFARANPSAYDMRLIRNPGVNGGGTLSMGGTGPLTFYTSGVTSLTLNGTAATFPGMVYSQGSNAGYQFLDRTASNVQWAWYATGNSTARLNFWNGSSGGDLVTVDTSGVIYSNFGYKCKAGTGGGTSNVFNIYWTGSAAHLWIDTSDQGAIAFQSDYRIKDNVRTLGSMWDRVKQLRPISYTLKDNEELLSKADPAELWGFIAHELQETLIERAATGYKDAPNAVQSPNPWVMLAAVVSTLQEAMARIEQLEGAR